MPNMLEDRLTRLEELTFFQEERIEKLDAALTAQQTQLDAVERELADARLVIQFCLNGFVVFIRGSVR